MSRMFPGALVAVLLMAGAVYAEDTVATVGSRTFTKKELEDHVKVKLVQIDNQRYEILQEGLDEMVAEELYAQEAKARGITVQELLKKEVESKAAEPTAAAIQKVYDDNKQQIGGKSLDEVKPQIVQYLKQQQMSEANQAFLEGLRKKYKTTILLQPPKVTVSDGGRPSKGKADAPIVMIEFSDFECPYCKRASGTVDEVLKKYGDKIRYVHRDFPLPFHASARPAAEAAACANDQGKYWEYQARLWKSKDLSEATLKSLAKEVGMDEKKFDECMQKKPHSAEIEKDMADGQAVGVNGTPAFFINGRSLSGAQPSEKFVEIIDDELARAK